MKATPGWKLGPLHATADFDFQLVGWDGPPDGTILYKAYKNKEPKQENQLTPEQGAQIQAAAQETSKQVQEILDARDPDKPAPKAKPVPGCGPALAALGCPDGMVPDAPIPGVGDGIPWPK